jgi:hypothetical protein
LEWLSEGGKVRGIVSATQPDKPPTRQDYISTATILREFLPKENMDDKMNSYAFRNLVDQFATMFADDNPRFDAEKFYEACGLDSSLAFAK